MHQACGCRLLIALLAVGALTATGCGQSAPLAGGPLDSRDTIMPQSNQPGSPTPGAGGTGASQVTSGRVTLTLDKQRYAAGEAITVNVANGLETSIWAADHQTNCTIATAERRQDGQWRAMAPCRLMIATHLVALAAGTQTPVKVFAGETDPQNAWPTGTYRVKFSYRAGADTGSGSDVTIYSIQFSIG